MNPSSIDWVALERMRGAFLDGTAGDNDYWSNESDLASYDATFAQRIGWKWDWVLRELRRRDWSPPAGPVLDWGCGSGIAGRAFLGEFGCEWVSELRLHDRSAIATRFAAGRARGRFPALRVKAGIPHIEGVVLLSHVLTELSPPAIDTLVRDLEAGAAAVLWVEPGAREASRSLVAIRERLRPRFHLVAPCTHAAACPMLAAGNGRHWCHQFAPPPPAVFTDSDWGRFARLAQVDLRSLPLSCLVLDRRPPAALPARTARLIGRPRVYKPHALLLCCDETGLHERTVTRREDPEKYRAARKGEPASLQCFESAS